MAQDANLLLLAQRCERDLDALLQALRQALKNGFLHIFDHNLESGLFTSERLAESDALLPKVKRSLKAFVMAARKDPGFRAQYVNVDFALRRLDIMVESIEGINIGGDLNSAIALVGNASSNIHTIIQDLSRSTGQEE